MFVSRGRSLACLGDAADTLVFSFCACERKARCTVQDAEAEFLRCSETDDMHLMALSFGRAEPLSSITGLEPRQRFY